MIGYRNSCAPVEVSFSAAALGDNLVARWLRQHRLGVDVHTLAELHSAISVGIHPVLMTVHADQLDVGDIRRASAAGVGRVVLSRPDQITSSRIKRTQNVLVRMTDVSHTDAATDAVIDCRSTTLIGLFCDVGTSAAIADMIAQMDHIRRRHNVVLTRLVLAVGSAVAAEEIDESVHDACAAMRFPRPIIVMAA